MPTAANLTAAETDYLAKVREAELRRTLQRLAEGTGRVVEEPVLCVLVRREPWPSRLHVYLPVTYPRLEEVLAGDEAAIADSRQYEIHRRRKRPRGRIGEACDVPVRFDAGGVR